MDPARDSENNQSESTPNVNQQKTPDSKSAYTSDLNQSFETSSKITTEQETNGIPLKQAPEPGQVLAPETDQAPKPKLKLFLIVLFIFLFLLSTAAGGITYAVAYEKVKLKNYPELQKRVAYSIQSLAFMPKTPKFLLAMSALAHQDVTKQAYNFSLALDSKDLTSALGLNKLDVEAKGAVDYSDPKNPIGTLDLSLTKDFNIELRKKGDFLYYKINKIPSFLTAFLGVHPSQLEPILDIWVAQDISPLDTEARKSMQDEEVSPLSQEFVDRNLEKYVDEKVLSYMKLAKDEVEGNKVYKISLQADAELIDYLGTKLDNASTRVKSYVYPGSSEEKEFKLSDMVKNLKWEIYIDSKNYYTRKVVISANLEVDQASSGSLFLGTSTLPTRTSNISFAFAVKFDKFGEEVIVEAPDQYMDFEEFSALLAEIAQDVYEANFKSPKATDMPYILP